MEKQSFVIGQYSIWY